VDLIGIEFTEFDKLFDFRYANFAAGRDHRIEVP
jgi:hypothetical protein